MSEYFFVKLHIIIERPNNYVGYNMYGRLTLINERFCKESLRKSWLELDNIHLRDTVGTGVGDKWLSDTM